MRPADVGGVAVHYSGMNADEQRRHANCASRVRGIQRYHQRSRRARGPTNTDAAPRGA